MLERWWHLPIAHTKSRFSVLFALTMLLLNSACDFGFGSKPKTTITSTHNQSQKNILGSLFGSEPPISNPGEDDGNTGNTPRGETPGVYNITDETFYVGSDLQTDSTIPLTAWSPACPPESGRMVCPIEYPISGDFDGDGYATIGFYQPNNGQFRIRLSYNESIPGDEVQFNYGPAATLDQPVLPVVGDWDNDGRDGIGVYLPRSSTFFLKNQLLSGPADITIVFGAPSQEITYPLAGDWDGDGLIGVGLYKPELGLFFLKNVLAPGAADYSFSFGPANPSILPIAGKWTGTTQDYIGIYDPAKGEFNLRFTHQSGAADRTYIFSSRFTGEFPLAGFW